MALSNLITKRHLHYLIYEVLMPLDPAVAIKLPGTAGSALRPDALTWGECEISLVQAYREEVTTDGRGEVCTAWTLDFTIPVKDYEAMLEYRDLVERRIEDVCMSDYVLLHDYSDFLDGAHPDRRWNLLYGGVTTNLAPSSRRDTAWAARDRRKEDSEDPRRREEFTIVVTMK